MHMVSFRRFSRSSTRPRTSMASGNTRLSDISSPSIGPTARRKGMSGVIATPGGMLCFLSVKRCRTAFLALSTWHTISGKHVEGVMKITCLAFSQCQALTCIVEVIVLVLCSWKDDAPLREQGTVSTRSGTGGSCREAR